MATMNIDTIFLAAVAAVPGILAYLNNSRTSAHLAKVDDRKVELEAYKEAQRYYDNTLRQLRFDYEDEKKERIKLARQLRLALRVLKDSNIPIPEELLEE